MKTQPPQRIKSISHYHALRGLPKPAHPLISVVNFDDMERAEGEAPVSIIPDFYSIALKRQLSGKIKYGQQEYDFDEGILFFIAPGHVFRIETDNNTASKWSGWVLLVHPDFLWNSPLAKTIKGYEYFDYAVNEALFLSEKEENVLTGLLQTIHQEYNANIDAFSQSIIIAQLELFLSYADRFYHRQFITRKITNHKILSRLETLLAKYFNDDGMIKKGLPTVQQIADNLNVSSTYLTGLLKAVTGQSTQQHIHNKLIELAKEKLSTTDLSVSEIAYELGFEHPQSFSKLFKTKTNQSPMQFRQAFN